MKNVLLTGASSGIGKSLALELLNDNHRVFACGRNQQALNELADKSDLVTPLVFDLTNKQAIADISERLAEIDIMIFNAGDCEYIDDVEHFDGDMFKRVLDINLISVGYGLQFWLNKLAPDGQIVFISSSVTYLPLPQAEAYGASKAGLSYLAQSLAIDLASSSRRITLVEPGFVQTPLTDKNRFAMPFIISAEQAAKIIHKGIKARKHRVRFPRLFIFILKLLAVLPTSWWHKLISKGQS